MTFADTADCGHSRNSSSTHGQIDRGGIVIRVLRTIMFIMRSLEGDYWPLRRILLWRASQYTWKKEGKPYFYEADGWAGCQMYWAIYYSTAMFRMLRTRALPAQSRSVCRLRPTENLGLARLLYPPPFGPTPGFFDPIIFPYHSIIRRYSAPPAWGLLRGEFCRDEVTK